MHQPLRLTLDRAALQSNWRWLAQKAGTATGAAIKADGYGIGARSTGTGIGQGSTGYGLTPIKRPSPAPETK